MNYGKSQLNAACEAAPVERNPDGLNNLLDQLNDRLTHALATVERLESKFSTILVPAPPSVQTKGQDKPMRDGMSRTHDQLVGAIRQTEILIDFLNDVNARFIP